MKRSIYEKVRVLVIQLYKLMFAVIPVQKNVVLFECSRGTNYTGNPRAIYEYFVKTGLDQKYECVWVFVRGKEDTQVPGRYIPVTRGTLKFLKYICKAHVWVYDSRQPFFLKKKANQHYIQTWHGTPLKKLALDLDNPISIPSGKDLDTYRKEFYENTRIWDYLIAQNDFSADIFRRCFAFDKEMLLTGYPRNDILFERNNPDDILSLKKELNLPLDKKILLYAPTYRDDEFNEKGEQTFTPKLDFDMLRDAMGDEYICIVKYHYFIENKVDWTGYEGFVYAFEGNADINKLYLVSDKMITDYSSVMFDFSLLRRPMYFYCYDLEKYREAMRGFYFDFMEEAPGPISLTTEELIRDLKKPDAENDAEYAQKREAFYKKFHTYEDGTASRQVTERIIDFVENQ